MNEEKIVNLKLEESVKSDFKDITRVQRTSMQSVLECFVKSYIEDPEQYKIIMRKGDMEDAEKLKEYADSGKEWGFGSLSPKPVEFVYNNYSNFAVEKVMNGSEFKGECHLQLKGPASKPASALAFFRKEFDKYGAEVGIVDPILKLNYPIYIILDDVNAIDAIDDIFKSINDKLERFKKEEGK